MSIGTRWLLSLTSVGGAIACQSLLLSTALAAGTQPSSDTSMARALESLSFKQDDDVPCLRSALESGDPDTGASTFLLKAPPGCLVKWHYHTAQEQVVVLRGPLRMEMDEHDPMTLQFGGFAVMQGGVAHQFMCQGPGSCLLTVSFDKAYDITWGRTAR